MKKLVGVLTCLSFGLHAQTYLGNYSGHSVAGRSITVYADTAALRFAFLSPEIVRVEFLPNLTTRFDSSLTVIRDTTESVNLTISNADSALILSSSSLRVICRKRPLRVAFTDAGGKILLAERPAGGIGSQQSNRLLNFTLQSDDRFYGTGERGIGLDLRGTSFQSYNTQNFGYSIPLSTMNINIPFLASTRGYALFIENTYPGTFDLGAADPGVFSYAASEGELSYYVIVGSSIASQLERYTWLTGRQPLPPKWAFGYIQSKFGYRDSGEARAAVRTMRSKKIPCDAIVLDLYWFKNMGDLAWDFSAWGFPGAMLSDLLEDGIKTIVITEPYITDRSTNFPEANAGGYLAKRTNGESYLLPGWWSCGCDAGLLDVTSPEARKWWWDKHPGFLGYGVAGLWTDLGEPESHPLQMMHQGGSAARVHNIYNLLWAKTIFEGYASFRPGERLFNLTRSGYAGIQRYGVVPWSGDVAKAFGGLKVQIPMLLNMGMSGLAYHNSDIGGFTGPDNAELYTRWMQYGTFCPITRAHGVGAKEPWRFGSPYEEICTKFIELRYRLLPYIYSMAYQNYSTGLPLARPLFFDTMDDPNLSNESFSYMWGDAFLVSPVVEGGQITKSVYLPRGKWINFWNDEILDGGRTVIVDTPLDYMPLFVKAGSIVPMQPVTNYVDEKPLDTLTLVAYPLLDFISSGCTLYEDDGKTISYQKGEHALTMFRHSVTGDGMNASYQLIIGRSDGNFAGKVTQRAYVAEIHNIVDIRGAVYANAKQLQRSSSYAEFRAQREGFYFNSPEKILYVQISGSMDSSYVIDANGLGVTALHSKGDEPAGLFSLSQNYPNPFNPKTAVSYQLSAVSFVTLKVYDVLGREVITLVNEKKEAGSYTAEWNAEGIPSGMYLYRLHARSGFGSFVETKRMCLVK